MRCYLIEDIHLENAAKIMAALESHGFKGPLEGIYYLPVPEEMLTEEQQAHLNDCGPYIMALEVLDQAESCNFKMELLVRARNRLRCSCVAYAAPALREWMIDFLDKFIHELDVPV